MTTAHEVTFGGPQHPMKRVPCDTYLTAWAAGADVSDAPLELVGPQGAARILGVSRQREMILRKRPDYPPPATHVDGDPSRPLWHAATIREYASARKATT